VGNASGSSSPACPTRGPRGIGSNPWPPAQRELAPRGAGMINLCRYSGLNSRPRFKLVGNDLVTDGPTIHRLLDRLDSLKSPPSDQAFLCPSDDGSEVLATLNYPGQHEVQILVTLSGCSAATNGDLTRAAFNFDNRNPQGPKLLAQLERLTRQLHG
jgi:hypothetical protein